MKRVFFGGIVGLFIGICISVFQCAINKSTIYYATTASFYEGKTHFNATIICFSLYILIGVIFSLIHKIYQKKNINLFAQTLIHLVIGAIFVLIIGYYLHWFLNFINFLIFVVTFLLIYILIWAIMYKISKKDIDEINRKLKR